MASAWEIFEFVGRLGGLVFWVWVCIQAVRWMRRVSGDYKRNT